MSDDLKDKLDREAILRHPDECLRGVAGCQPLERMVTGRDDDDSHGFICIGNNNGVKTPCGHEDTYTVCWKSVYWDLQRHFDYRDLMGLASVIMAGLTKEANIKSAIEMSERKENPDDL